MVIITSISSATIEIFARLQQIQIKNSREFGSATIEIFARLQLFLRGLIADDCSATIEIFARLQPRTCLIR